MSIHTDLFWPVFGAIGLLLLAVFAVQRLRARPKPDTSIAWEDGETR